MEARLKNGGASAPGGSPQAQRQAVAGSLQTGPAIDSQKQQTSRPNTAKPTQQQQQPVHGGAMPPTPTASEGELLYRRAPAAARPPGSNS